MEKGGLNRFAKKCEMENGGKNIFTTPRKKNWNIHQERKNGKRRKKHIHQERKNVKQRIEQIRQEKKMENGGKKQHIHQERKNGKHRKKTYSPREEKWKTEEKAYSPKKKN